MIAGWMLRFLVAATLIALAARMADEVARGFGWPRRWVWAAAFLVVASIPWLGAVLPMPSVLETLLAELAPGAMAAMPVDASAAMVAAAGTRSEAQSALDDRVLALGWAVASLALALVFGMALLRFRLALRRGTARVRLDGIDVIRVASLGPATIGIVRPAIVLPRWVDELPVAERALIVSHEREHATARDPLLLAAAALIVTAAPWCLPLWWMHRRLRDAAEADCDARVVARGADRLAYGRALLRAAGRPPSGAIAFAAPLLGGVNATRLERRILKMTERRPKHPLLRAVPLMAVAAVAVVVACDAADQAAGAPERAPAVGANDLADEGFFVERVRVDSDRDEGASAQRLVDAPTETGSETKAFEVEELELETADPDKSRGSHAADQELVLPNARIEADTSGVRSISGAVPPDAPLSADALAAAARKATEAVVRLREQRTARGPSGPEPVFYIGGASGPEPVFYIDGERVADHSAALKRLDPEMIERIEVLKGAAASLYGPQHTAGVVQIYTKKR